ncbi:zinc-binding protein A33-like [Cheilinus undulatus]|uniref:zinc-binding protein A33-like n=1 Tax=Cheilinus undulatus TaxID=241271 RepID=UPI001BD6908B|nr:zinc-binding protein A33-like [Cheilinus undulatus]
MSLRSEEDFLCPICHEIFEDPVVLSCSHSFCKGCLQRWWKSKQSRECPCCMRRSSKSDPPRNLALRNLCEAFVQDRDQKSSRESEALCSLHSEKLKLFCLDHLQPVCVVCRDSKIHNNHKFRPIDEAVGEQKAELQKILKPIKEKIELFKEVKEKHDQTAEYIKVQAQNTERRIKEQFDKLHQFLQKQEEARISALREEEEQKSQKMKEKIEALKREIASLTDTIRATEKKMIADNVSFLQNFKTTLERIQQRTLLNDPAVVSGALIDEAKHLGNLSFKIWSNMKEIISYTPVILDPNTADPELVLSDDLTSVRSGEPQQLPKNHERTKFSCSVLGSEGFDSGTHCWEVVVGANKDWELGILGQNIQKSGQPQSSLWRIMFSNGKFTAFSTTSSSEKNLTVKKQLHRIRVQLDFDGGELLFSDGDTNTPIHTFTDIFTNTLYPYIYTENHLPLEILSLKLSMMIEKLNQI